MTAHELLEDLPQHRSLPRERDLDAPAARSGLAGAREEKNLHAGGKGFVG